MLACRSVAPRSSSILMRLRHLPADWAKKRRSSTSQTTSARRYFLTLSIKIIALKAIVNGNSNESRLSTWLTFDVRNPIRTYRCKWRKSRKPTMKVSAALNRARVRLDPLYFWLDKSALKSTKVWLWQLLKLYRVIERRHTNCQKKNWNSCFLKTWLQWLRMTWLSEIQQKWHWISSRSSKMKRRKILKKKTRMKRRRRLSKCLLEVFLK